MLKATGDGLVAKELTSRVDLPDTAPYGIEWSQFLIGFPHRRNYILGRTMLDPHASRTGMVFTHALISPLDDMVRFDNLHTLIAMLCEHPCPDKAISPVEVPPEPVPNIEATPEQIALATLLVSPGKVPIVRLGCDGFDNVVAELWGRLWPSIRRGFAFRLSFGPSDLIESPLPSLVCTPPNLSARWIGYRTVSVDAAPKSLSPAAALLTGKQEGGNLLDYAAGLGIEVGTFGNLILLERAYALQASSASLDNSIALLRIVEALSPGQRNVTSGKEEVAATVLRFLPGATAKQALSLRNVTLTSLEQADRIWNALGQWMANYEFPSNEDAEITQLLRGIDDVAYAVPEWQRAIVSGLNKAKTNPSSQLFEAFWRWGVNSPDVYDHVFQCIPFNLSEEEVLVESAPDQLASRSAQQLLALSVSRRLYRLHGVAASMMFSPMDAVRMQLDADKSSVSSAGIQLALRKAQPAQIVECALAFQNSQLSELAATAVSLQPELLADVEMSGATAQGIWAGALHKNQACWSGPKQPKQTFHMILSEMLDGGRMETPLIVALSNTPLADLDGYTRRKELWSCLVGGTKERLMEATTAGWLKQVESGTTSPLEAELQLHIIKSPSFRATVERLVSTSLGTALKLISLLSSLNEEQFLETLPWLTSKLLRK